MRVIEASELIASDVFTIAEQTRQRITFGDVQRHLAQLARPSTLTTPWASDRSTAYQPREWASLDVPLVLPVPVPVTATG